MNEEQAKALRAPFDEVDIGQLPKLTCKACSDKNCQKHQKQKCAKCGNWISTAHMHLDFVGHAALTDRLLQVDPEWSWEPMAVEQNGAPAIDQNGGMWIRLTVCGVTRIGYGDADGKKGGSAVKETIGDALRNAGMRFGMALDLWRKEPLPQDRDEPSEPDPSVASVNPATEARKALAAEAERVGLDLSEVSGAYFAEHQVQLRDDTDSQRIAAFKTDLLVKVTDWLTGVEAERERNG